MLAHQGEPDPDRSLTSPALPLPTDVSSVARDERATLGGPFWKNALHILAVFNFALSYPLLNRVADRTWFFVAERAGAIDLVVLALTFCLVMPGVLIALEALAGLISERVRNLLHAGLLMVLLVAGLLLIVIDLETSVHPILIVLAVILAGAAATLLYLRTQAIQMFVTFLSIGIVIVPINFLFLSDASSVVFPGESPHVPPVEVSAETPLVMVVYDELPLVSLLDDRNQIDPDRYPNFASLADDAYWFRNATTVSQSTMQSVPAMLTGTYPRPDTMPTFHDYPGNLFTMLGGSHQMQVNEPVTQLCPDHLCGTPDKSFQERVSIWKAGSTLTQLPSAVTAIERDQLDIDFNESIEPTDRPTLYYHHSMLPHWPWVYLPSGATYEFDEMPTGVQNDRRWVKDEWLTTQAYQRHLVQLMYTDRLLGGLLDQLRKSDLYDDALIIVVADHGITFTPDVHFREAAEDTIEDISPVPLLIKRPHQTDGVVSDQNVQTIDILPTIADVLEIEHDWDLDGFSVFDNSRPDSASKIIVDTSSGERIEMTPDSERLKQLVRQKLALFAPEPGVEGLFKIGPYAELVGQNVEHLAIGDEPSVQVVLDSPGRYEDLERDAAIIPALITGHVPSSDDIDEPIHLAIAVNGTVHAVTRTYVDRGDVKFTALLPEIAFQEGTNEVEVLVVSGSESDPEISRAAR